MKINFLKFKRRGIFTVLQNDGIFHTVGLVKEHVNNFLSINNIYLCGVEDTSQPKCETIVFPYKREFITQSISLPKLMVFSAMGFVVPLLLEELLELEKLTHQGFVVLFYKQSEEENLKVVAPTKFLDIQTIILSYVDNTNELIKENG